MQGQWDEAETRFRKLHEHRLHRVGPRHPMTLTAAHYLGQVSLERGDLGRALERLEHVLDERMAVHGESHKWTHYTMNRSEEHTSELQSLMRISYAVFCLKKTKI